MSDLIRQRDIERARALIENAQILRAKGESPAVALKDWHLAYYSYLYQPYVLLLDPNKRLEIVMSEDVLLQAFGHQIWSAFLHRMGRTYADVQARPRLTQFDAQGRLGLGTDYLYGAKISEVFNWVP